MNSGLQGLASVIATIAMAFVGIAIVFGMGIFGVTFYVESRWGIETAKGLWETTGYVILGLLMVIGITLGWAMNFFSVRSGAAIATNAMHETVDGMGAHADNVKATNGVASYYAQERAAHAKADAQISIIEAKKLAALESSYLQVATSQAKLMQKKEEQPVRRPPWFADEMDEEDDNKEPSFRMIR